MISNILWPLALLGGLGAFIDFVLGSARQERIKNWLLAKWVKFDDMKWTNFSEKEAQYFVLFQDRIFWRNLLSWRRAISSLATYAFLLVFFLAIGLTRSLSYATLLADISKQARLFENNFDLTQVLVGVFSFAVSLSLTRLISIFVIRLSAGRRVGPSLYFLLLAIHYFLFAIWRPVVEILKIAFWLSVMALSLLITSRASVSEIGSLFAESNFSIKDVLGYFKDYLEGISWAPHQLLSDAIASTGLVGPFTPRRVPMGTYFAVSLLSNALRILVALGLLVSYVLREWIGRFFSLLWVRVLEDRRGVFTLILGGIGALAGLLKGIVSH